ncbi:MAG: hypothetical protein PV344_04830, partial [Anaplasma sp.]|nr:hypothetical protein [Anaplasma sp.]
GPVRIAFSFASHSCESHIDLVLMTQHSSFPSRASVLAWPSQYRVWLATEGSWVRIPPKILQSFL